MLEHAMRLSFENNDNLGSRQPQRFEPVELSNRADPLMDLVGEHDQYRGVRGPALGGDHISHDALIRQKQALMKSKMMEQIESEMRERVALQQLQRSTVSEIDLKGQIKEMVDLALRERQDAEQRDKLLAQQYRAQA